MRRADRLFQTVRLLRRGWAMRAVDLASCLGVSKRTTDRDITDMVARGVSTEHEARVGYIPQPGFDLPALVSNENEVEVLPLAPTSFSPGPTRNRQQRRRPRWTMERRYRPQSCASNSTWCGYGCLPSMRGKP